MATARDVIDELLSQTRARKIDWQAGTIQVGAKQPDYWSAVVNATGCRFLLFSEEQLIMAIDNKPLEMGREDGTQDLYDYVSSKFAVAVPSDAELLQRGLDCLRGN